jgi:hypothetical protein
MLIRLLKSKFPALLVIILFFGIISVLFYSIIAHASVYNLYATSCLGGWKNTHLASSTPEADNSDITTFNENNSAVLENNAYAQIFCGGFSGDIEEKTIPQKVLVKFSWAVLYPSQDDEPAEEDIIPEEEQDDEPTEEDTSTDITTEETGDDIPASDAENTNIEEEAEEENLIESTTVNINPTIEGDTQAEINIIEGDTITETEEEVVPDLTAEEAQSNESSGEDTDTDTLPEESGEEGDTTTEETSGDILVEDVPDQEISYGLVEVMYTLDGEEWRSLGFVREEEFNNKNFEIPIEEASEWEDVSRIQIAIRSLPNLDEITPEIYLDSVWLEAEYKYEEEIIIEEEIEEEIIEEEVIEEALLEEGPVLGEGAVESQSLPEFISKENVGEIIPERIMQNIILNPSATHSCEASTFFLSLEGEDEVSEIFKLFNNSKQSGTLIIGSLPGGIDARFVENNSYELKVTDQTKTVEVKFIRGRGAQKGNFNISLIYQLNSLVPSNVLCQTNLVN